MDQPAFGKLPTAVTLAACRTLTATELRVFVVLAARVDGRDWRTRPGIDVLTVATGKSARQVRRALQGLATKGLIVRLGGGCRGHATEFQLATDPEALPKADTQDGRLSGTKADAQGGRQSPGKAVICAPKGGHLRAERRSSTSALAVIQSVPPSASAQTSAIQPPPQSPSEPEPSGTQSAAAGEQELSTAGETEQREIIAALTSVGVSHGGARRLARLPGMSAELVRAAIAERTRQGLDEPGGLVNALRDSSERQRFAQLAAHDAAVRAELARADAEYAERRRAEDAAERQRRAAEAARLAAALAAELDALRAEYGRIPVALRDEAAAIVRGQMPGADPDELLRATVLEARALRFEREQPPARPRLMPKAEPDAVAFEALRSERRGKATA